MSLDSEVLKVYNERNESLSKRVDFGLKYSLLGTKEYHKYITNLVTETLDSSVIEKDSIRTVISKLDHSYKKIGINFKPYYDSLSNISSYSKKIDYINSINNDSFKITNEDIYMELNALKNKYSMLIDSLEYLKSDKPNEDIFDLLDTSITQNITDDTEKYYRRFSINADLKNRNISKYLNNLESNSMFLNSLNLNKDSFSKVYFRGNKTKVLTDIITAIMTKSERNYMPKETMNLIESKYDFISFSESDNPSKVFINGSSFKTIWYKVKKSIKSEVLDSESLDSISKKDLLETLSIFVNESSSDFIDYDLLSKDELLKFVPSYTQAKKLGKDLSSILGMENVEDLNIFGRYYHLKNEVLNDYSKKLFASMPKDELINFYVSNMDILKYYTPLNNVKDIMNDFSEFSCKIMEINLLNKNLVNEVISEHLAAASNSSQIFDLHILKDEVINKLN
jgi:hypothetical protein